jgi:hypothetical protein
MAVGKTRQTKPDAEPIPSLWEYHVLIPERYLHFVKSLPERERYQQIELLVPDLRMESHEDGKVVVYYAPFEWCNPKARLAIVGVTPGFTQMEIAIRVARRELIAGTDPDTACKRAKYAASFAGTMRQNLVSMLDGLNLSELLRCTAEELFTTSSDLLHATSVVRFPVFVDRHNYTGCWPPLTSAEYLMKFARERLAPELANLRRPAIIPLGKAVEKALRVLETEGLIPIGRTLYGFPHPSGANGHRARQYEDSKRALTEMLRRALE